jgi:hypothetical protein
LLGEHVSMEYVDGAKGLDTRMMSERGDLFLFSCFCPGGTQGLVGADMRFICIQKHHISRHDVFLSYPVCCSSVR